MPADALPDLTNYGLLGAFLLLVVIFLGFGVVILRYALGVLKAVSEEWARRNSAREEVLTNALAETRQVIRDNTEASTRNAEAFRTATGAFEKVDKTLIRLGANGHS